MAEPKVQPKAAEAEQDLSMEEILQSIRRIIAEEGEEAKAPTENASAANDAGQAKEASSVPGSDVLELTDMVKEEPAEEVKPPSDILESIDIALAEAPAAQEPAAPAAEPVTEVEPAMDVDALLSDTVAAEAAASLRKVTSSKPRPVPHEPAPSFRHGYTVEDLALEALKPMLKEWLDANLSGIVERIVEREVRRLSGDQ